jgi:hypothetical protein
LKQGDPLSPFLFILAVDGLPKRKDNAINHSHFKGLGPVLPNGKKLAILQYADDTLTLH